MAETTIDQTTDLQEYRLTPLEQRSCDEILERIELHAGLFRIHRDADHYGEPIRDNTGAMFPTSWQPLRGKRYCIDRNGRIWRLYAEGTSKTGKATGGGAPWRTDMIEMWTGSWRKVKGPDGKPTYAKHLIAVPVGLGVNQKRTPHLDWYQQKKGFKHPFDPPHAPTAEQIAVLQGKEIETHAAVLARMDQVAEATGADPKLLREQMESPVKRPTARAKARKKPKRRSNRPKPAVVPPVEAESPAEPDFAEESANAS